MDDPNESAPVITEDVAPAATETSPPAPTEGGTPAPSFDWKSVPTDAWRVLPPEHLRQLRAEHPNLNQWISSEAGRDAKSRFEQHVSDWETTRKAREQEERILGADDSEAGAYYKQQITAARERSKAGEDFWPQADRLYKAQLASELDGLITDPDLDLTKDEQAKVWAAANAEGWRPAVKLAHQLSATKYSAREIKSRTDAMAREARAEARGEEVPFETANGAGVGSLSDQEFLTAYADQRVHDHARARKLTGVH